MTYAIKWEEILLVTNENQNNLIWYKFVENLTEEENLLYEKTCAETCGYSCEIIDGVLIKTPTEASRNFEISEKIKKIDEIEKQIRSLWETETSSVFLQNVNTTRVSNLRAEKTALESELDEMTLDLDQSVIDQIIASIF